MLQRTVPQFPVDSLALLLNIAWVFILTEFVSAGPPSKHVIIPCPARVPALTKHLALRAGSVSSRRLHRVSRTAIPYGGTASFPGYKWE